MFQNTTPFADGPSFHNNYSTVMAGLNKNFGISNNRIGSIVPAFSPYDPPPQLNFFPYIGGQAGAGFTNFLINTADDPDTRTLHGSGWEGGAFFGIETPMQFAGLSTRFEGDYWTTNARATIETMFAGPITKSICGETSVNFLVAYRTPAAPAWAVYGGGGAGFVNVTVRTPDDTNHQYGAAFNAIAGIDYNLTRDWAVGARYTWVAVEPLTFGTSNVKTYANFAGLTATYKPVY